MKRALAGSLVLAAVGLIVFAAMRRQSPPEPPPRIGPGTDASFIPDPSPFVTDIPESETASDTVAKAIKSTLVKALRELDRAKAIAALSPDFRARIPGVGNGIEVPDGSMQVLDYPGRSWPETDAAGFFDALAGHLAGVSFVERSTWRPFEFLIAPDRSRAVANVHFQLAGPLPDGTRRDLYASVRVEAVPAGDSWSVRRLEWFEGAVVQGRFRPWEDITQATGFSVAQTEEARKVTQDLIDSRNNGMFGGIAVHDFNGDGFWDLLCTRASGWSRLFMNDGQGGFLVEPGPELPTDLAPSSWLCVDLDNDGQVEIVGSVVLEYTETGGYLPLFRKTGERWVLEPRSLFFSDPLGDRQITIQQLVPADIDGNGFLDILCCVYSNSRSLQHHFNTLAAYDGNDNWLFMNQGGLKFTEESDARGITGTQYTFVAKVWDLDFDGDDDIYECNDYGPNVAWVNDGKGRFTRQGGFGLEDGSNYTMGVTIADYDNTGQWSIYISNMYSHAGNRIVPLAQGVTAELRGLAKLIAQGNQLYSWEPELRRWRECAVEKQVNQADWAWACLFADFDNDTDKDLFVANGFTSHEDASAPDY